MANIAVLGYGTVGSGVVEVLNTNKDRINSKSYEPINIKYVLDLRDFPGDPVQEIITHDYNDILNDNTIDVVVEVMVVLTQLTHLLSRLLNLERVFVHLTRNLLLLMVESLWLLLRNTM